MIIYLIIKMKQSAGILIYKRVGQEIKILLVHPGGPFFKKKDLGFWSIPKGHVEKNEEPFERAKIELKEETGIDLNIHDLKKEDFISLGKIIQKNKKEVEAWSINFDPGDDFKFSSVNIIINAFGKTFSSPEIDKAEWFDLKTAKTKVNPAQVELIERLENLLGQVNSLRN